MLRSDRDQDSAQTKENAFRSIGIEHKTLLVDWLATLGSPWHTGQKS